VSRATHYSREQREDGAERFDLAASSQEEPRQHCSAFANRFERRPRERNRAACRATAANYACGRFTAVLFAFGKASVISALPRGLPGCTGGVAPLGQTERQEYNYRERAAARLTAPLLIFLIRRRI